MKINPVHMDHRGTITDILSKEEIDGVTIIHTESGEIRGNHYHKETTQWLYVLSGVVMVAFKAPGGEIETVIIEQGEMVKHNPMEVHAYLALSATDWLVLTKGPRSGTDYESDTFRVDAIIHKLEVQP